MRFFSSDALRQRDPASGLLAQTQPLVGAPSYRRLIARALSTNNESLRRTWFAPPYAVATPASDRSMAEMARTTSRRIALMDIIASYRWRG